jgi:hypothetical protein
MADERMTEETDEWTKKRKGKIKTRSDTKEARNERKENMN